MSILLSGDFHANASGEISSITKNALLLRYHEERYGNIKYHIILGDSGFSETNNKKIESSIKILAPRPFPILCVIGSHEQADFINNLPEVDIGIGETVYQISAKPFIAYLKRGKTYSIEGIKILALGGVFSPAVTYRRLDITPLECKYWSEKGRQDLFNLLNKDNVFDIVISNTGPHSINKYLFESQNPSSKKLQDETAFFYDEIEAKIDCREWWCGCWHQNVYCYDEISNRGYQYLYKRTKILEKKNDTITFSNEWGMEGR